MIYSICSLYGLFSEDDVFRYDDASTHDGHLRQNYTLFVFWFVLRCYDPVNPSGLWPAVYFGISSDTMKTLIGKFCHDSMQNFFSCNCMYTYMNHKFYSFYWF